MPAVIDETRFSRLTRHLADDGVRHVVGSFLEWTPKIVERIVLAAMVDDRDAIRDAAHRLRGGCLAVGAHELAETATSLERLADDGGSLDELRAAVVRLEQGWSSTSRAYRSRVS